MPLIHSSELLPMSQELSQGAGDGGAVASISLRAIHQVSLVLTCVVNKRLVGHVVGAKHFFRQSY